MMVIIFVRAIVRLCIRLFICLSERFVRLFVHLFVHKFVYPSRFVRSNIHSNTCPPVRSSICPFQTFTLVQFSILLLISLSYSLVPSRSISFTRSISFITFITSTYHVHSFVHPKSFVLSSIHPLAHPFTDPFVHPSSRPSVSLVLPSVHPAPSSMDVISLFHHITSHHHTTRSTVQHQSKHLKYPITKSTSNCLSTSKAKRTRYFMYAKSCLMYNTVIGRASSGIYSSCVLLQLILGLRTSSKLVPWALYIRFAAEPSHDLHIA